MLCLLTKKNEVNSKQIGNSKKLTEWVAQAGKAVGCLCIEGYVFNVQ